MSDSKLVDLPADASLTGTEELYVNDGLVDKKVTATQVKAFTLDTPVTIQGDNDAAVDQFTVNHGTVRASRTIGTGNSPFTANSQILFTADTPGFAGNSIEILAGTEAPNQPLSIGVVGSVITVNLQCDAGGTPISTANQVITAINANAPAAALVTATLAPGSNGTALWAPNGTASFLIGGLDAGAAIVVNEAGNIVIGGATFQQDDNSAEPTLGLVARGTNAAGSEPFALEIIPEDNGWEGAILIDVGTQADLTGSAYILRATTPSGRQVLDFDAFGSASFSAEPTGSADWDWHGSDDHTVAEITMGETDADSHFSTFSTLRVFGNLILWKTVAPTDGELGSSQAGLYFDDTDGAAYVKFKGKSADGTVVNGKVRLGHTVQTWNVSNVTTDRTFDANATTVDELADAFGTLVADLRAQGFVG